MADPADGRSRTGGSRADLIVRTRKFVAHAKARTEAARLWSALVALELATIQDEIAARAAAGRSSVARPDGQREARPATRLVDSTLARLLAVRLVAGFEDRAVNQNPRNDRDRVLARLRAQVELRAQVTGRIDQLVADSRAAGATWAGIARALNVTRQSAHQRYGHGGRTVELAAVVEPAEAAARELDAAVHSGQ